MDRFPAYESQRNRTVDGTAAGTGPPSPVGDPLLGHVGLHVVGSPRWLLEVSASFAPGLSQTTITLTSPATAGYFTQDYPSEPTSFVRAYRARVVWRGGGPS